MASTSRIEPGDIGGPYRLGADAWAAIDQRVDLVVMSAGGPIGDALTKHYPQFGQLADACQAWNASTYPNLMGGASVVADQAGRLDALIEPIAKRVAAMTAHPTKREVEKLSTDAAAMLTQSTTCAHAAASAVGIDGAALRRFADLNQGLDAVIVQLSEQFGPLGSGMAQHAAALDEAAQLASTRWTALVSDLRELSKPSSLPDIPLLRALDLDPAAVEWKRVATEAGAFASRRRSRSTTVPAPATARPPRRAR